MIWFSVETQMDVFSYADDMFPKVAQPINATEQVQQEKNDNNVFDAAMYYFRR